MAGIELTNLHKRFDEFVAVERTNLRIEDREFFVLLGPSGCGKTTTLRMIAGLELPTSGEIRLDREDVTYRRPAHRDIAFVFQLFALYEHMSVRRNIAFPLRVQGVPRAERETRVDEVARLLRIEALLDRGVHGLSSGDRQRVALGRAIVRRAKAFLMDEPLGALDAEFREHMASELRLLHDRIGATTVYVTHDQVEAMAMADRIGIMNRGQLLQVGAPMEVYRRPATKFVAGFIGNPPMNFLEARGRLPVGATTLRVQGAAIPVPLLAEGLEHPEAIVGVRPEHVAIVDDGPMRGRIFGLEYMGRDQLVTVDTAAGRLKISAPTTSGLEVGDNVGLRLETEHVLVFDPTSDRALRRANEGGLHG